MNKEFHFSPDDWGFAPSINSACLEMIRDRLCHTVSISIVRPYVEEGKKELLELRRQGLVRLALHLDFTHIPNIRMLDKNFIRREVRHQWKKYLQSGFPMDSINGHRHCHTWPIVTAAVAAELRAQGQMGLPVRWMRDRSHPASFLSAAAIRQVWRKLKWHPTGYLLARDLQSKESLEKKLLRFEQLICHPSHPTNFSGLNFKDKLQVQRVSEYQRLRKLLQEM